MKDERLQRDKVFSRKRSRRKWRGIVTCLAAVVVLGTVYSLIHPAITMTKDHPTLAAEELEGWSGDELKVRVTAETETSGKEKTFVLISESQEADIAPEYYFNEEGICVITDEEGNEIELHRAVRENKADAVDYWFTLPADTHTAFTLELADRTDPSRFAETVKAVREELANAGEETAEAATASNAEKAAVYKATPSRAERASGSNASYAILEDAKNVETETHDDGFKEILDGAVVNDLGSEGDEEAESVELTASLRLSAGFGDGFAAAVRDAERNADKRGDAQLKFAWKDIAEKKAGEPSLSAVCDGAVIAVYYDSKAGIPADASLSVRPIEAGTEEYALYAASAGAAVSAADENGAEKTVNHAKFFDITILDGNGNEIEPDSRVKVVISYAEAVTLEDGGDLNVVHFQSNDEKPDEISAEVLDSDVLAETAAEGNKDVEGFSFMAESFSVYGIVYTVDFHFNGVDYSIPGNTQILLTQLIRTMHITVPDSDKNTDNDPLLDINDVASVEFTDRHLVQVDQVSGLITINSVDGSLADVDAGAYNFLLSSRKPFSTNEMLTVTLKDGKEIKVGVTDGQRVEINFYDTDGTTPAPATNGGYNYIAAVRYGNVSDVSAITIEDTKAAAVLEITPGIELYLIRYDDSEGPLTQEYLGHNWWYEAAPVKILEKTPLNGKTLGVYDVSKVDDTHYKAVKKSGYTVNLEFMEHDYNQTTNPYAGHVTPGVTEGAKAINEYSFVRVLLYGENEPDEYEVVGYAIAPVSTSGSVNSVILDEFTMLAGGTMTYSAAKNAGYSVLSSGASIRVGHKEQNQAPSYDDFDNNSNGLSTGDYDGYTFAGQIRVSSDERTVRNRVSDPAEYYVEINCDDDPLTLPSGVDVYALVKATTSTTTLYAYAKVTAANTTDGGKTYRVLIPETSWFQQMGGNSYQQGSNQISGHESNVTVSLAAVAAGTAVADPSKLVSSQVPGGGTVQTHVVERYPSINNGDLSDPAQRTYVNEPGVKSTYTDYVYLEKNDDRFDLYTLEKILNGGYIAVTLCPGENGSMPKEITESFNADNVGPGDAYIACHQMGGILIRGDVTFSSKPTGIADSPDADNPSVVGGYFGDTAPKGCLKGCFVNNRTNNTDSVNFYLGSSNSLFTVDNGYSMVNGNTYGQQLGGINHGINYPGNSYVNDQFVDWDRLQSAMVDSSEALLDGADPVIINAVNGDTVDVPLGSNVIISCPDTAYITVNIVGENAEAPDAPGTVINFTNSNNAIVPLLTVNGNKLSTDETGEGMSVVWNYPNTTGTVSGPADREPEFGHVLAPKALISMTGGNFSGTMVGNNVYLGSDAEGHLYPYKGDTILGIYGKIISGKTVNGGTPAAKQKYNFILEKLVPVVPVSEYDEGKGQKNFWKELQTIQNQGGNISFDDIHFPKAGDYWFMVSEDTSGQKQGETFDETKYLVYVKVVNDADAGTVKIEGNDVKIYRINDIENLLTIGDVSSEDTTVTAKKAEINYTVITPAADIVWGVKGSTIESGIIFGNTVADASVTFSGTKTLEGQTLTEGQFTFTVKDAAGSVVATGKNKADGSIVFTPITYSSSIFVGQPTAELEFTYKVTEDMPGATEENQYTVNGIKYDSSVKTEKVKVTLNDDGTISAEWVTEGSDPIAFANKVDTGSLEITKKVTVGGNPTTTDVADGTYTFHVYDAENKLAKKANGKPVGDISITITGGRSNSAAVDGLAPGTYYVMEVSADNKQIELDTKAKQVIVSSSATGKAEITNNIVQIEIPVEKKWSFVEKSRVFRSLVWPTDISVEVELLKSDSPNGPWSSFDPQRTVVLSAGKMKDKFTGLDKKDVNGNAIYYNVKELPFIGTKPGFDPANFITSVNGNETEGFVITNEEQPRGLTVVKSFQGDDLTDAEKNRITFTVSGPGLENGSLTKSYADFTNGSWTLTGDDGIIRGEEYTVTETNADVKGYKRTTKVRVNEDGEEESLSAAVTVSSKTGKGSVQFINTYEKKPIEISGQKTWRDGGRTHENAEELTLKLYRTASPSNAESVWEEVSYDKETQLVWNGNSYRITGLEPFGTDSSSGVLTPYAYRVEEGPMNTETPYMQETDPQHQNSFINTELTEAEVKKEWKLVASDSDARKPVTVTLYRGEGTDRPVGYITLDGTPGIEPEDSGVKGWEDAAWHAKWTNLPKYESDGTTLIKYTVRETEGADGFTVSYPREEGYALSGESILNAELTAFDFTKKWQNMKGDDQNTWPEGKEIVVKIVRIAGNEEDPDFALVYRLNAGNYSSKDGIEPDRDQSKGTERPKLTFRKDTAFSFHLEGLTKFDGEKTYEYYVSETNQVDGYEKPQYFDKTGKQVEEGKGLVGDMAPDGGTIVNKESTGYELPSTGGPGTVLYTVSGLLLTGAAILYSLMRHAGRML